MSLNGAAPGRLGVSLSPSDLTALSRYLTFQSFLPKNGGLFGSGWAQFMADRASAPATPDTASAIYPPADADAAPSAAAYQALRSPTGIADPGNSNADGRYELAAASPRGVWDYWSPQGCANCHGYTPGTLPPVGGHSPFPPSFSPYARGAGSSGGGASPEPEHPEPPQCKQQEQRDNSICKRQVAPNPKDTPEVRAICHASRMDRYGYCLKTKGEIGFPQLMTYKAQQGEPPIQRWRKP
jgi:hypothetical protein